MSFSFATFLSINLISSFCTQFQLSALIFLLASFVFLHSKNFKFLHCLGLIDMLSANQHGEIFSCILLTRAICNRNPNLLKNYLENKEYNSHSMKCKIKMWPGIPKFRQRSVSHFNKNWKSRQIFLVLSACFVYSEFLHEACISPTHMMSPK